MKTRILSLLLAVQGITILFSCSSQKQKSADIAATDSTGLLENIDTTVVKQEAMNMIGEFYKAYTTAYVQSVPKVNEDSIRNKYLTKRLIEKIRRMGASTDGDPVIRAQDFHEDLIRTLNVKHLKDNWYMISYSWDNHSTDIPLKVIRVDGQYKIDYITPPWNESLYGDSSLCDQQKEPVIDSSTPLDFVKSFYEVYTMKYARMPEGLADQLAKLRTEYLTAAALEQFDAAEKDRRASDGFNGYDLLINDYDFDCLWRSLIRVTKLNEDTYQISFSTNEKSDSANVKITKQGSKYMINSIVVTH